ncbi:MAG: ATP-binding protein [bacterium]|nr:ATP-binding protein [bacterium]
MDLNNWYVITGAPSAGKTTLIKLLEEKGYDIVHEAARTYIDQEIRKGKIIDEIRRDELLFQEIVLKMKIEIEESLPKEKIIFFDRGIPDSEAYYKLYNRKNDEFLEKAIKNCSYKKIFLLDFYDMDKDYARIETKEEQIKIHYLLKESYKKINAHIIIVPLMSSIEDRLNFILKNL